MNQKKIMTISGIAIIVIAGAIACFVISKKNSSLTTNSITSTPPVTENNNLDLSNSDAVSARVNNNFIDAGIAITFAIPSNWKADSENVFSVKNFDEEYNTLEKNQYGGHQPWRLEPRNAAGACLLDFGINVENDITSFSEKLIEIKKDEIYALEAGTAKLFVYLKIKNDLPIAYKLEIGLNETADWQVYKNELAGFTFKYPSSWEIRKDYFYETAGGAKADEPTVVLCDKKVKKDSMGDCMQINMPQAPSNEYTKTIGKNWLNLYTDDPEIVNAYEKIVSSFKIIDGIPYRIIISSPKTKDVISSPAVVSGKAKGNWFFEGVFPVKIYDANDKLLGEGPAHFEGETWMTEEFVNFKGEIGFKKPTTETGYIIFKNDNPSGLPEHDESFKLQINFLDEYGYAEKTLLDFFTYLKNKEYDKAVDLLDIPEKTKECPSDANIEFDGGCGYGWEGLERFSPQEERNNKAKVLENYARLTKEATLQASITGVEKYSEGKYILTVQFLNSDGSILVEGPCCGATEEQMPSSDKFEYKVKKIDGIFKVITAPLYRS